MNTDAKIDIKYEDESIIVCHKPAGFPVQTKKLGQPDMETWLKNYLRKKQPGQKKEPYLAVIHRLDQPVEGLLVFAKTKAAAASLSKQVSAEESEDMIKCYHAEVYGSMPFDKGELMNYLLKDARTNTSKVVSEAFSKTPEGKAAKRAFLEYEVLESDGETQLLKVRIHTGRHHQIRVQLSHAGCPIVGDTKYGTEQSRAYTAQKGVRYPMLKAVHLTFIHPVTGETMGFSL